MSMTPGALPTRNRWVALAFICLALLVLSINNNSINVALPRIAEALDASAADLQWIEATYLLVFSSLMITLGSLGDRTGRRRGLITGLLIFGVAAFVATLAQDVTLVIAARAIMGLGAAFVMPATLSLISANFPEPKERAQAIGFWTASFGLGMGLGPMLAGVLLVSFEWTSVFLVNVPVVVLALVGAVFFIGESRDPRPQPLDPVGALLSIVGLAGLVYALIEVGTKGWTATPVIAGFVLAVVFLTAFGVWEAKTKHPMLPMFLFRNPSFTAANAALTVSSFTLFGASLLFVQYFQNIQGRSPLEAGVISFPIALAMMVAAALSPRVAARLGIRITVAAGTMAGGAAMLAFGLVADPATGLVVIIGCLTVVGLGLGFSQGPATSSVMAAVPTSKAGVGSAMNDTTRELGGALGIATLGSILSGTYIAQLSQVTALGQLPGDVYEQVLAGIQSAQAVALQLPSPAIQAQYLETVNAAFMSGFQAALVAGGLLMVVGGALTLLVLPDRAVASPDPDAVPARA